MVGARSEQIHPLLNKPLTVRQRAVSRFHAGQMRVYERRPEAGVAYMKRALVPKIPPGLPDDWNIGSVAEFVGKSI